MKRKTGFTVFLWIVLSVMMSFSASCGPDEEEFEIDSTPCNKNASDSAKAVLKFLAALSSPDVRKAVAGQNCYHGDEITEADSLNGYKKLVADLYEKTGQWVGIVGVDYEYMKIYSPRQLAGANAVLKAHWEKGGLVAVTFSPKNPWVNNEAGVIDNSQPWNGPGSPTDRTHADLKELLDP
jgi:mannan endo-1,4-beta-mannosidase